MLYNICYLFLMFFIFSIIGYIAEITSCSIRSKKMVYNRGFCLGPYLPIYGICMMVLTLFVVKYREDFFTVFVVSCFICGVIEFFTSYILEKIFKARWWDYSDRKFNIDGRVCLSNIFLFGLGGILFTYLLYPIVIIFLDQFSNNLLIVLGIICMIIFIIDEIITIVTLCQVKVSSIKFKSLDITSEITKIIRNEIFKKKQIYNNFFVRHMLNAFPNIDIKKGSTPLARLKKYYVNKHKNK